MGPPMGFLGKTRDRFSEYNEDRTTAERLEMASQMEGIEGIEAVFPYSVNVKAELESGSRRRNHAAWN